VRGDVRGRLPRGALTVEELAAAALAEDVGDGDRTTRWTVPPGRRGRARVVAREAGVVAGTGPASTVLRLVDGEVGADWRAGDGDRVEAGDTVAAVEGPLAALLTAERTMLNFLGRLSGVATLSARFVAAVEGTGCRVTDTRKTTPGWRRLEKAATAAGGAVNHRMGLHDMVLVKENHLRAAGGVREALRAVTPRARAAGIAVEIEVGEPAELEAALDEAPDRILLDNMEVPALRRAVRRVREAAAGEAPLLEASGGITLDTVRDVAETGVDLVSVGALTHSAPALDLSMLVEDA
jgi:nicotinate-nucleotide pyrophosphorylase (carboxylating)